MPFPTDTISVEGFPRILPRFLFQEVIAMKLGAVLIAAGCSRDPMRPSGTICAAQRLIAALQKSGAGWITVVTGPEDRKQERQMAGQGVCFLHCEAPGHRENALALGLEAMAGKCSRLFLLSTDHSLVEPRTLDQLIRSDGELVIPTWKDKPGQPLLMNQACLSRILEGGDIPPLAAWSRLPGSTLLPVEDRGVLAATEAREQDRRLLDRLDRMLTRPTVELAITRGKTLVDGKLVTLLYLIGETLSVRIACSRMQISYSTAWNLLDSAEEALGYPLVLRNKGGPSGCGTLLTEKGRALLQAYQQFESAAREQMEQLYSTYLGSVL